MHENLCAASRDASPPKSDELGENASFDRLRGTHVRCNGYFWHEELSYRMNGMRVVRTRGGADARPWAERLHPYGWRHFWGQILLFAAFEVIYAISGAWGRAHATDAIANARSIMHVEDALGIGVEHGLQDRVLNAPHLAIDIANRTYWLSQFTVSTVFLFWVYMFRTEKFALVRNALIAANVVQTVGLLVYPTAPPRLVPGAGFADTLNSTSVSLQSSFIDALNNPYSAMPSLHVSYAAVFGIAGVALSRTLWARCLWALYPLLVTYSVIATGNHFVLDAVAGVAALAATPLIHRLIEWLREVRLPRARVPVDVRCRQ
jgi:hypothetical protein